MTEALDGTRWGSGGIMKFPQSSNIESWKNAEQCKNNRGHMLPYYFDPNSNLMNESVIRTLLGEIMIGNDKTGKLEEVMGLKKERRNLPINSQVMISHKSFMLPYAEFVIMQTIRLGWHPPKRYEELFEKTNENFWNNLSLCYRAHLKYSRGRKQEPKSITGDAGIEFGGRSCLEKHTAINYVNSTVITSLPEYDIFVLEKIMALTNWIYDTQMCRGSSKKRFQNSIRFCQFHYAARNYDYLMQYCQNGSRCDANQIDNDLSNLVSKIHFLMSG